MELHTPKMAVRFPLPKWSEHPVAARDHWNLNRRSESPGMTGVALKEDRSGAYQDVCCDVVDGIVFAVPALAARPDRYRMREENGELLL